MSAPALGNIEAVVIGCSAGGIEALSVVLPALPAALRAAVFVVVHLPPERPSLLVNIFRPKCVVQVREAEDKEPVIPGTVYFAPPDYHLLIDTGPRLALSTDELVNFSRPSIDVLFESAADVYGKRLMGVILTGGNSDGSKGLAAIQSAGGTVVVQDPAEARAPLMVNSALERTTPDFVLSLQEIAGLLQSLAAPARKETQP
jgi:two-component system chemotaxis response regulator CheB